MKIEFTRAEVERIILNHANSLCRAGAHFDGVWHSDTANKTFNTVEGSSYRGLPDTITVSVEKEQDAAQ